MTPYFNISTRGASASGWLSLLLNAHPNVVCFHGREELFGNLDVAPTPEAALQALADARRNAGPEAQHKAFGIIHTFYGTEPRQAFLAAGGTFAAILRDPFTRIHSLLTHHAELSFGHKAAPGKSVYQTMLAAGLLAADESAPLLQVYATPLAPGEKLFASICETVLDSDMDNIANAFDAVARFEQLVSDASYLTGWLGRLLGGRDRQLDAAVAAHAGRPQNVHAGNRLSAAEVFAAWPDRLRKMFFFLAINDVNWSSAFEAYERAGYAMPPESLAWLRAQAARV